MTDTVIAEDLREDYADFQKWIESQKENGWRSYARGLIERCSRADAEVAALRAKVERLEVPASDEEWNSLNSMEHGDDSYVCTRDEFNALVAARGREGE